MIKFLFCGDFVSQEPEKIEVSEGLQKLIKGVDYAFCNFEAPIKGFGSAIAKSGPALTQSADSPRFLETLGFNLISLANNHMMDMGEAGCTATMSKFNAAVCMGAGNQNSAYIITTIEKDGLMIGFLPIVQKEFGTLTADSCDSDFGTAWINHPLVNRLVLDAKSKCDVLIVLPHAGMEDLEIPLPEWRTRYKELIDFGADIVIASHPHTPQGWEDYHGKRIYYSLGNFYFQLFSKNYGPKWFNSQMVEVVIEDDKSMRFKVHNACFSDGKIRLDKSLASEEYNKYLCSILNDSDSYKRHLERAVIELWETYKLYILRGLSGISLKSSFNTLLHCMYGIIKGEDACLLLNNFQCESHRWLIERAINLKYKLK